MRRDAIDPAVAELLNNAERRQELRRKPRAEQAKIRADAARSRATYDVPKELRSAITFIARQEGISASAAAALLLADGVRRYREGHISLSPECGLKQRSESPKYEYTVPDGAILSVLRGNADLGDL